MANIFIKGNDIVTIPQLQNDIAKISAEINERLKDMQMTPVGVDNSDALQTQYPQGKDGVFLTQNDKHLWTFIDGRWQDLGPYEAVQLDQKTQQSIGDTKSLVLGDNFIQNGSFSDGKIDPAHTTTSDTNLSVTNYLNRYWLNLHSDPKNQSQYKGVQWDFSPIAAEAFYYPLALDFDYQISDFNRNYVINLLFYDAKGQRIGLQSLGGFKYTGGRFAHLHETITLDKSYSQAYSMDLQIIQNDALPITKTLITGVSLKILVDNNFNLGKNLIPNGDFANGSTSPAYVTGTQSNKFYILNYFNRNWATFVGPTTDQYKGYQWDIDLNNGEIFNYPLRLSFDIQSAQSLNLGINFIFYDAFGKRISTQNIGGVDLISYSFTHFNKIFKLTKPDNVARGCLQIIDNNAEAITKIMLTDIELQSCFNQTTINLNRELIKNGNFADNINLGVDPTGSGTQLGVSHYLGQNWLSITSPTDNKSQYKGINWVINNFYPDYVQSALNMPLEFKLDMQSSKDRSFAINIFYYDATGKTLSIQNVGGIQAKANLFEHFDKEFTLWNVKNAVNIGLKIISNDAASITKVMISNVSLKLKYWREDNIKLKNLQQEYHLPIMTVSGDVDGMSKDTAKQITWSYLNGNSYLTGFGTLKWQGDSSTKWPKKGYRLKTLSNDYKSKAKVKFISAWSKHDKFNLKAYYTDGLMSRDPVNAQIGAKIWSAENDIPQDLVNEDNFGFIDGFPIVLFINDDFQGIYSLNLPRPDFSYTKYAIIGSKYCDQTAFRNNKTPIKLDGTDFESLNPDDKPTTDEIKAANNLLTFVSTSNDTDFKAHFSEHLDLTSCIDYLIFSNLIEDADAWGKNQVLLSWDGKVWYWHPYDLDVSFGGQYDGTLFGKATDISGGQQHVFGRIISLFPDQIKQRYTELRSWLTPALVLDLYKQRINQIGVANFKAEHDKWNDPAKDVENYKQLKDYVYNQFKVADKAWLINSNDQIAKLQAEIDTLKGNDPTKLTIPTAPTGGNTPAGGDTTKTDNTQKDQGTTKTGGNADGGTAKPSDTTKPTDNKSTSQNK